MAILQDKRIVLGVTGGIAAYKSIDLASKLVQAGARVDVILTESARQFVTPLPFEAITKRRVHSGVFEGWSEAEKGHISLAEEAELIIVAPATANSIARLALGLADDMLTVTHLAAAPRGTPIVIAPAMEHHMYLHPATQQHLETLRSRGAVVVDPDHGRLASGAIGIGRLPTTERLIAAIEGALSRGGPLWKKRVVVTAGATQEAIDPIRLLTNRSSGRMGYALAHAALQAGADVTLITTPTALPPVIGATTVPVTSAIDMRDAVATHAAGADALIMAAAVADYRPASVAEDKIKKSDDDLVIQLVRNPDILATVETPGTIRVGFAAETTNHEAYARDKLARKNLDFIVLNDARAAMGADSNAVTLFFRDGRSESLGEASKAAVAEQIMQRVADLVVGKPD
ncbi:MAG: bifunctional phosphopantothenoylcysteine decarboxylase/phosphopantothenate--cysteine ligase CoaBC [Thermomicrobiales bacterium]|nr:bifunctional phosphopantothenoylcysteine decarboxylase/phosphopantothenate--cysteine ligase CoaBC [Thermomicrobiales bacterium]